MKGRHSTTEATITGGLLTALVAGALAGCGASDSVSTQVQMLWYGTTSDGRPTYGVTPVAVDARTSGTTSPMSVDMSAAGSAGEQWQTAAWTAAAVGTLLANTDPRGQTISYRVDQSIDGPSAGAVLTTAALGDLTASGQLSESVTMTGTVLPSGAVGPVGGIPAKVRAAAEAGIDTVLVPQGQSIAVDPATGQRVAVLELGAELGIEVVPVASVQQAFEYFNPDGFGQPTDVGQSPAAATPLQPPTAALFTDAAQAALQRVATLRLADSAAAALEADRRRIAAGVDLAITRTPALLAEGRVVDAFARITLAERELLAWNAQAQAAMSAAADPAGTTRQLASEADELVADSDAAITAAATSPVTFLEQAAATPDALCWATDSWANASVIAEGIQAGAATTTTELGAVAGVLAAARYDLATYLPFSLQVARSVGTVAIADPRDSAALLASYASLLADTGQAGLSDARRTPSLQTAASTRVFNDPSVWEFALLQVLADRWADLSRTPQSADSPALVSPALSTAMSFYVAASTLAATTQLARVNGSQQQFQPSDWTTQVDVASAESWRSATQAEVAGLDPDYLAWNEGFGRGVATAADAIGANDALRLGGLQVQWYGNAQGHMLLALADAQQTAAN